MSGENIRIEKRLLGYDVWVDANASYQSYTDNRIPIEERVADFVKEMRAYLIDAGLPDPLRLVAIDHPSGWRYCDANEAESLEADIGYQFSLKQIAVSDRVKEKLVMLSHAVSFLSHHENGGTTAAYEALFLFSQSYTLHWAEVDARPDMERGQTTLKAASAGGAERARMYSPRNSTIIEEMENLIASGHTAKRAAELAARKGIGSTQAGNLQVWYRRQK